MFKSKHKYITFNALHKKDTQVQSDLYSKVSAFEQPPEHHMVSRLIQNWKKKKNLNYMWYLYCRKTIKSIKKNMAKHGSFKILTLITDIQNAIST